MAAKDTKSAKRDGEAMREGGRFAAGRMSARRGLANCKKAANTGEND